MLNVFPLPSSQCINSLVQYSRPPPYICTIVCNIFMSLVRLGHCHSLNTGCIFFLGLWACHSHAMLHHSATHTAPNNTPDRVLVLLNWARVNFQQVVYIPYGPRWLLICSTLDSTLCVMSCLVLALPTFMFHPSYRSQAGNPSGSSVCLQEQPAHLLASRRGSVNACQIALEKSFENQFLIFTSDSYFSFEFPSCSLVFCMWTG